MKNKFYTSLIISILCQFLSSAQDVYWEKATLTDSSGIEKQGYVNRNTDMEMSFEIQFKNSINSNEVQKILPALLKQVQFESDHAIYEKVVIEDKINSLVEARLLKCLLQGYCSLYRLSFKETKIQIEQYGKFVLKKEGKDYVLEQKESITSNTYYKKENKYWGVLNYLFQDVKDAKLKSKMEKLDFTETSLIDVIQYYNEIKKPNNQNIIHKEKSIKIKNYGLFADGYYVKDKTMDYLFYGLGFHYETQKPAKTRKRTDIIGLGILMTTRSEVPLIPIIQVGTNYYFRPQQKNTAYVGGGMMLYFIAPAPYINLGIKKERVQIAVNLQLLSRTVSIGTRLSVNLYPKLK